MTRFAVPYRFLLRRAWNPLRQGRRATADWHRREITHVVVRRPRRQLRAPSSCCFCWRPPTRTTVKMTTTTTPPAPSPSWPSRATITTAFRLSLIALLLLNVGTASASICKAGLCSREQYCCGDGKCCDNVYSVWYLWWVNKARHCNVWLRGTINICFLVFISQWRRSRHAVRRRFVLSGDQTVLLFPHTGDRQVRPGAHVADEIRK